MLDLENKSTLHSDQAHKMRQVRKVVVVMMGVKWALFCPPGVAGESGERREESCGAATRKVWRLQPRFAPAPACQVTELGLSGRLRHLQAANTGRKFRELGITWFMVVWAPHWCQYPGHLYILYVGSESMEREIHNLQSYKLGTILKCCNHTIKKTRIHWGSQPNIFHHCISGRQSAFEPAPKKGKVPTTFLICWSLWVNFWQINWNIKPGGGKQEKFWAERKVKTLIILKSYYKCAVSFNPGAQVVINSLPRKFLLKCLPSSQSPQWRYSIVVNFHIN